MEIIESAALLHEGAALQGYLALPAGKGPHRAVMVMHNAYGVGEQVRRSARKLAAAGYVALATDMYGGARYSTLVKDAGAAMLPLTADPPLLRRRVNAWLEWLQARPEVDAGRVGAIGYCFGGHCVLELARSGADVKLVVSYHGLLKTELPATPGGIEAKIAVYTGAKDPYAPLEEVAGFQEEMLAAGASWQLTVFGDAFHSFTDPDAHNPELTGLAYDPLADRLSWAGTEVLLEAVL